VGVRKLMLDILRFMKVFEIEIGGEILLALMLAEL
jgi:hypothetical protein